MTAHVRTCVRATLSTCGRGACTYLQQIPYFLVGPFVGEISGFKNGLVLLSNCYRIASAAILQHQGRLAMPEHQYRSGLDEQVIRQFAHQLWEEEGRPEGRELENWLEAEARLCVKNQISYLIPFCDFSVHIPRTWVPPALTHIACSSSEWGYMTVSSSRVMAPPGAPVTLRESTLHDSRVVLVELTAATAILDRIARMAELFASADPPRAVFLEPDASGEAPRIKSAYIRALLDPATHQTLISELDNAISNFAEANFVAFDISGIFLEGSITLGGTAKALCTALIPIMLFSGDVAKETAAAVIAEAVMSEFKTFQENKELQKEREKEIATYLAAQMAEKRVDTMQKCLSKLGYNPGPVDRIFGPRTETAFKEFCQHERVRYDWPHGKAAITQLANAVAANLIPH